jgi:hypothetical protein
LERLSELECSTDESAQTVVDAPLEQPAAQIIYDNDAGCGEQQRPVPPQACAVR